MVLLFVNRPVDLLHLHSHLDGPLHGRPVVD